MQAYRDYIGGHKLEFLPRLKGCQKYPSPTSMSPTSMTHVIYLLEVITWHAKHFFTWQASIPPAACPKQRLSLVIWIQLVDGSLSNNRLHSSLKPVFLWRNCDKSVTKVAHVGYVIWQEWQWCDKNVTKNGSFEATEVSLPSNADLILDLPNLWRPNQQACIPVDLNWQTKFRDISESH